MLFGCLTCFGIIFHLIELSTVQADWLKAFAEGNMKYCSGISSNRASSDTISGVSSVHEGSKRGLRQL